MVRGRFRALGSVLYVMMCHLSPDQLESIDANLSSSHKSLIASVGPSELQSVALGPTLLAKADNMKGSGPLVACDQNKPPITKSPQSALEGPHRAMTSTAVHVSKRDADLLRSVLNSSRGGCGQNGRAGDRCQGCGAVAKTGSVSEDDGCLYCKACWQEWSLDKENGDSRCSRTISQRTVDDANDAAFV